MSTISWGGAVVNCLSSVFKGPVPLLMVDFFLVKLNKNVLFSFIVLFFFYIFFFSGFFSVSIRSFLASIIFDLWWF